MKNLVTYNEHTKNVTNLQKILNDFKKQDFDVKVDTKFNNTHYQLLVNGFIMHVFLKNELPSFAFISRGLGASSPSLLKIIEKDEMFYSVNQVVSFFKKHLPLYSSKKLANAGKTGVWDDVIDS